MLKIYNGEIIANTDPNIYAMMKPWQHESGANWWIVDAENGTPFTDSDGQIYLLRQRTQAEIEATPEYQAWSEL